MKTMVLTEKSSHGPLGRDDCIHGDRYIPLVLKQNYHEDRGIQGPFKRSGSPGILFRNLPLTDCKQNLL